VPAYPSTPPTHPLADLGFDPGWAAAVATAAGDLPGGAADLARFDRVVRFGRVVRVDRGHAMVHTGDGPVHATCTLHTVTGDWALLTGDDAVAAVLPRRTTVVRGAGRRDARAQPLAANVDVVLVLVALSSPPNLTRLDRLLTVAWDSGAEPVVVLTKADLARTAESEAAEVAEHAPGVPVHVVSTVDGRGLDGLRAHLGPGRTVVLLGVSGVGKSSLVNALAGTELAGVGAIRDDGRGRHTTTSRELLVLPGLGILIDTPGLRGVQLWDAEDGLARTFADVEELAAGCRFGDCTHVAEPGCAVVQAVAEGRLSALRLSSMRRLQRELAWLRGRYDARLRAERRREWQQLARRLRERGNRRRHG
jgi:ribosome biogenesis GTPase